MAICCRSLRVSFGFAPHYRPFPPVRILSNPNEQKNSLRTSSMRDMTIFAAIAHGLGSIMNRRVATVSEWWMTGPGEQSYLKSVVVEAPIITTTDVLICRPYSSLLPVRNIEQQSSKPSGRNRHQSSMDCCYRQPRSGTAWQLSNDLNKCSVRLVSFSRDL